MRFHALVVTSIFAEIHKVLRGEVDGRLWLRHKIWTVFRLKSVVRPITCDKNSGITTGRKLIKKPFLKISPNKVIRARFSPTPHTPPIRRRFIRETSEVYTRVGVPLPQTSLFLYSCFYLLPRDCLQHDIP